MSRTPVTEISRPTFSLLAIPPILAVPSAFDATGPRPDWRPADTHVSAGEPLIASTSELHTTPIAPVTGVIGAPVSVHMIGGRLVHAIELRPDGEQAPPASSITAGETDAAFARLKAARPNNLGTWLTNLQKLGVSSDRWTSPDLIGQLQQALLRPIDRLVCSLLDTDPWLAPNRLAARARPRELAAGLGLLSRLTAADQSWALFDQLHGIAELEELQRHAAELASDLRLAPIENDYPQPDPTLIVYAATGRRLRPGRLPTEQSVLLIDATAAADIGQAVLTASPQTQIRLVFYDQPSNRSHALLAAPGTPVSWLMTQCGVGPTSRDLYAGSPLRQVRVHTSDVVGFGESCLFAAPPQPSISPSPCIRCGWCVEGCPTRCRPAGLLDAAQNNDLEAARQNGLDACIECGLCTYVCPSRLPILDGIRALRR